MRSPHLGRLFASVAMTATLLVACGASGGNGKAAPTTTKRKSSGPTTTQAQATTTSGTNDTTTTGGGGKAPTRADLVALLPPVSKLGAGWKEAPASGPSDNQAFKAAAKQQCPALTDLQSPKAKDADKVVRSYVNEDQTELEVTLNPHAKVYGKAEFQKVIDAITSCGEIHYVDPGGLSVSIALVASVDGAFGEQAARLAVTATITGTGVPTPLMANSYLYAFRRGPVGVSIQGSDGINASTLKVVDVNTDLLQSLAGALDQSVKDLVGAG